MNPRFKLFFQITAVVIVVILLAALFPPAFKFMEMAARELRYFWWVILLMGLALWLIFGLGRKRP